MAEISAKVVMGLRERTGAGMMDCKKALIETNGDEEAAIKLLREKGIAKSEAKAGRTASEGFVGSYIHLGGKIGVMVEVNCETDFVARNEEFQGLAKELAMQIAFSDPRWLDASEIPEEVLEREREIAANLARNEGRPEAAIERIVAGRVKKFSEENCLLSQPYIKETKRTVSDIVQDVRAKLGENIQVRRFVRFQVGKEA